MSGDSNDTRTLDDLFYSFAAELLTFLPADKAYATTAALMTEILCEVAGGLPSEKQRNCVTQLLSLIGERVMKELRLQEESKTE
jgi:hypothetical protein